MDQEMVLEMSKKIQVGKVAQVSQAFRDLIDTNQSFQKLKNVIFGSLKRLLFASTNAVSLGVRYQENQN